MPTADGTEFLGYARQVAEQISLLDERYKTAKKSKRLCAVSTQHYAFAVDAFVNMVKKCGVEEYEFTLRETRTSEIIDDVKNLRSELGILYFNSFNRKVLEKILKENLLDFHPLFSAKPHVFIAASNPLAKQKSVSLADLDGYPCLTFEQGENNSFYFSEEILSTASRKKNIRVSDRATLFNLLIGLNGYTVSTGIVGADLNGENIIAVPLDADDNILVGYVTHKSLRLTKQAQTYLDELKAVLSKYGLTVEQL